MEKTAVLTYLLECADAMRLDDKRNALSANYFIVALIDTCLALKEGELKAELATEENLAELRAAEALLRARCDITPALRDRILSGVREEGYNPQLDEFQFRKALFRVREEAKKTSVERADASLYLSVILESPPVLLRTALGMQVIETTLVPPSSGTAREEARPTADSEEKGTKKRRSSGTAASKPFSLDGSIKKAMDIQRGLLERVVGQDLAVAAFASGCFQSEMIAAEKKKHRGPLATFLFAGPPGVGKTFLAESAAELLGLPFLRVDMSEYADNDSLVEFCGSDNVYKNGKEGNITKFVTENPRSVILFDEIEKAHLSIIHLFLQILDTGSIRDNFTDKPVSFGEVTAIFTTNVGRKLYEDPSVQNLAAIPRKRVLEALATERDPKSGTLMFPTAICSRFASGNVLMFNRLGTDNLYFITKREIDSQVEGFTKASGIQVEVDRKLPTTLIFAAGGKTDARTIRGRASTIFHEEMYELLRLMRECGAKVEKLKKIKLEVSLEKSGLETSSLFVGAEKPKVLVFAEEEVAERCRRALPSVEVLSASDLDSAKALLFNHDFLLILTDIDCRRDRSCPKPLNREDTESVGMEFLAHALTLEEKPVYLLLDRDDGLSEAERLSFARMGTRGCFAMEAEDFEEQVVSRCDVAYQQEAVARLARDSKVLSYKTVQSLSKDGSQATVSFCGFRLARATDSDDAGSILDAAARPSTRFPDVIGAEDAKRELTYFSEYLKDPRKYARRGLRAPKGVLLYGPPGTGKTMLAKALAGESDVTFLATEGNRFLKRYVGEGPAAVHDLFRTARKYAPAIIFIDEIDAIAKDRSEGRNDEQIGDILTALLTEMDGFSQNPDKPVFVLAATNYAVDKSSGKSLDPAILRRFDRRIYVDLPNKEERLRYCEMRVAKSPAMAVSREELENLAIRSVGMSLAQLESVFEMALRGAVHSENGTVGDAELEEAFETFTSGEKRSRTKEAVTRTACHEAGHALLCWLGGECPSYLTVVSRGDHGGYMQHGDTEDKGVYTRAELLSRIRTSLAGRAAELVYYGEEDGVTTGPSGDLAQATSLATHMLCTYGMDDSFGLAALSGSPEGSPYYGEIRKKINGILEAELLRARHAIEENRRAMDALVAALVEKNQLKGKEIEAILTATVKRP